MPNENISLLDYFAGKVIEGCCYNMNLSVEQKAKLAFDLAEQMVKEKEARELLAKGSLVTGPDQFAYKTITEAERKEFPHHTDDSILGIRAIRSIESADLQTLLDSQSDRKTLCLTLGPKTNPEWVLIRVAEECYNRGLIDHVRFDEVTR